MIAAIAVVTMDITKSVANKIFNLVFKANFSSFCPKRHFLRLSSTLFKGLPPEFYLEVYLKIAEFCVSYLNLVEQMPLKNIQTALKLLGNIRNEIRSNVKNLN